MAYINVFTMGVLLLCALCCHNSANWPFLQDFNEKMDAQRRARGKGPPAKGTMAVSTHGDACLE